MEFDELKAEELIDRPPDIEADPDDDADDVESEVVDYVVRMLKKDKDACIAVEDVPVMVKAEMEYEDSVI